MYGERDTLNERPGYVMKGRRETILVSHTTVDVGEEGKVRTICSGLVNHVPLERMQERLGVFLCNLKTAK